ncbi:hypothetical protein [Actinomadura latina]|nr:hypothetical protein [Actinomadura latina]
MRSPPAAGLPHFVLGTSRNGQCTRGTPGPEAAEYGMVDPEAGAW